MEPYPRQVEAKIVTLGKWRGAKTVAKIHLSKKSEHWQKTAIKFIMAQWRGPTLEDPLRAFFLFYFMRPQTVSVKKRPFPSVTPDLDNLLKNTMDALTKAQVWADDALVVSLSAHKKYCEGIETPRVEVIIEKVYDASPTNLSLVFRSEDQR